MKIRETMDIFCNITWFIILLLCHFTILRHQNMQLSPWYYTVDQVKIQMEGGATKWPHHMIHSLIVFFISWACLFDVLSIFCPPLMPMT